MKRFVPVPVHLIVTIILLSILSTVTLATPVLVHLSRPISIAELTQLGKQAHVIHDLRSLSWLVLEIPRTRQVLYTYADGITQKWLIEPDIYGYFAATPTSASSIAIPNDPRYAEQWHLKEIGAPLWWEESQGEGIIIALLDSGVDPSHPDLDSNILFSQGEDFGDKDDEPYDDNGHGTAMAGLMVAKCQNYQGVCGIAPAARVIPYKINSRGEDRFWASDLAAGILAAANSPAQILSLSLVLKEISPIVQDALLYAKSQGKIVVAAAGNEGIGTVAYPAYLPWVIGVGAVDKTGQRLRMGNYGPGLSLSAPGVDLLTTLPGTDYANWFEGTSAAAALVSGALALMMAQQSTATPLERVVTLLTASQDINSPGFDNEYGFGNLKLPHPSPVSETSEKLSLKFTSVTTSAFRSGENVKLGLYLNNVTDITADLYLRLNLPSDTQGGRYNLFKIWKSNDSLEQIPYNHSLTSPYRLLHDLFLPLYGAPTALLGTGWVKSSWPEGAYELLALLDFADKSIVQTRKIIWVTKDNRLKKSDGGT